MDASPPTISNLTPYVHVRDLHESIAFYQQLGFNVEREFSSNDRLVWALLKVDQARLMLALASPPINPELQGVLFYCWTDDVAALRAHLAGQGVPVGSIQYPHYMPNGKIRASDPDGYVLLIGQRAQE